MKRLGAATESAVLKALILVGHSVLLPFERDQPYDLVVHDAAERFWRVQCKTGGERDGRILFNSCSTDHGRGRLDYRGRADLFGVWCPSVDRVYIVPVEEATGFVTTLRLAPTRNAQQRRVRWAADFAVEAWLPA